MKGSLLDIPPERRSILKRQSPLNQTSMSSLSPKNKDTQPSKISNVILNQILYFLKKENLFIDPKTFDYIISTYDLSKHAQKFRDKLNAKPTNVRRGDVIVKDPNNVLQSKILIRPLAGKMYASELWSKKQYLRMAAISPMAAKKDALRKLGLEIQQVSSFEREREERPHIVQRRLTKRVAHELFAKIKHELPIREKDIQMRPSLHEKVIARMKSDSPESPHSPSPTNIQAKLRRFLSGNTSPVMDDLSFMKNSRNMSHIVEESDKETSRHQSPIPNVKDSELPFLSK